jgi:hypothetical protein
MKRLSIFLLLLILTKNVHGDESYFPQRNIESISASSVLENRYNAENIIDTTWRSWAEGSEGSGIGESFTIKFKMPVKVGAFILKNGYGQLDYYYKNNRVKSFEVLFDDETSGRIITIEDSHELEWYNFPETVWVHAYIECTQITFKILDIYPGTQYNDTCIAEIYIHSAEYRSSYGYIENYPDIWRTYRPDSYTIRLLQAFYEDENIRFRLDENNRPQYRYFDEELREYHWGAISTSLTNNGNDYKIFLSPAGNPILLRIKEKNDTRGYIYSELSDKKEFINNRWQTNSNATAFEPILQLKNEIEAKGLVCDFRNWDRRNNVFSIRIDAINITGEYSVGERKSWVPYEIIETYILYWNGQMFERK